MAGMVLNTSKLVLRSDFEFIPILKFCAIDSTIDEFSYNSFE